MRVTRNVRKILDWYEGDPTGANIDRACIALGKA